MTSTSRAIDCRISSASIRLNDVDEAAPVEGTGNPPFPFAPGAAPSWPFSAASDATSSIDRAGPETLFATPLKRSRTSAAAVGFRASLPLKMTSSIRSPRRLLALCSPITQVMASATLLLPQPFGPTMAVTPLSKASSERSENDLKPLISNRSRRMGHTTASSERCLRDVELLADWETVWQLTDFLSLSPSNPEKAALSRKTVVSVTRATYWGKGNLVRKRLWLLAPTRCRELSVQPSKTFVRGPPASAPRRTSSARHATADQLPPDVSGLPRRRRARDRSRTGSSPG